MQTILLSADRPALQYTLGGETHRWEYDVVTLKLQCEQLEAKHQVKGQPSDAMLTELANYLREAGLQACNNDVALRVHSLVKVQFGKLARSIAEQLDKLN